MLRDQRESEIFSLSIHILLNKEEISNWLIFFLLLFPRHLSTQCTLGLRQWTPTLTAYFGPEAVDPHINILYIRFLPWSYIPWYILLWACHIYIRLVLCCYETSPVFGIRLNTHWCLYKELYYQYSNLI